MNDAERKPFFERSKAQKLLYEQQMAEFQAKGYFTLPDGTKSQFKQMPGKKSLLEKRLKRKADKKMLTKRRKIED